MQIYGTSINPLWARYSGKSISEPEFSVIDFINNEIEDQGNILSWYDDKFINFGLYCVTQNCETGIYSF